MGVQDVQDEASRKASDEASADSSARASDETPEGVAMDGGPEAVTEAEVKPAKKTLPVRGLLYILAAIVVLAGAGGAVWWSNHKTAKVGDTKQATPAIVTKEQQVFNSAATQSDKLDGDRQYGDQAKELKTYLDTNPPADLAIQAYAKLGAAYLNSKDYPNALTAFQKELDLADKPGEKMAAIHGLALAYKQSGNTAAAIEQYKAAIAIAKTQPDDEQSVRIVQVDTAQVKQLGGSL